MRHKNKYILPFLATLCALIFSACSGSDLSEDTFLIYEEEPVDTRAYSLIQETKNVQKYSFDVTAKYHSVYKVLGCGFCYTDKQIESEKINSEFVIGAANIKTVTSKFSGDEGTFTNTIDSLKSVTTYYVRSYIRVEGFSSPRYSPVKAIKSGGKVPAAADLPTPEIK